MGPRSPRRRARSSEDQVRVARVREDRAASRLPLLRQRRDRPRSRPRRARTPLRRGRLCVRGTGRPAHGDRGRGSSRLVVGDRIRGLVQRPSRLPGDPVRSLVRARHRGRERQRRRGRRADARAQRRRACAHRHDGRGDRCDRRLRNSRDPRARAQRAGAGGVHDAGATGADGTRRSGSHGRPRRPGAGRRERRGPGGRHGDREAQCRAAAQGCRVPSQGQVEDAAPALLRLARGDPGRRPRRGGRGRPERAGRGCARSDPRGAH